MKLKLISAFTLLSLITGKAQTFEPANTTIQGYYYSSIDVGDFNNDGHIDWVINGAVDVDNDGTADVTENQVFINQTTGNFSPYYTITQGATHLGDIKFIDFDNDGLLDLVSTGLSYNDVVNYKQYRLKNTGSSFQLQDELNGKIYGNMEVLDFNHDGKQDYVLNGTEYTEENGFIFEADLYLNNGTSFDKTQNWLAGSQNGSIKIGDFNNDNQLDVIINGFNSDLDPFLKIYLNNNGVLEESQSLLPITNGDIALADFNADGFLDFVVSGQNDDYDEVLYYALNDGNGNFSLVEIPGLGLTGGKLDAGDLNNDGYYDFINSGNNANYDGVVDIFTFNPNTNTFDRLTDTNLYQLGGQGGLKLLDYDNDNHLDVVYSGFDWESEDYATLTKLYRSSATTVNEKPLAPTQLMATPNGNTIEFSWSGASDDKTPVPALKYEISVGTTPNTSNVAKYVVNNNSWYLNFEQLPENLFWSVRSIDAAQVYSDPSALTELKNLESMSQNIHIYPNPTVDKINIQTKELVSKINLYGANGEMLMSQKDHHTNLDLSGFNSGVYVIKIFFENGKTQTQKIIKK